jgi:hypothetical protein
MEQNLSVTDMDIDSEEFCFDYCDSRETNATDTAVTALPPILFEHNHCLVPVWGRSCLMNHRAQRVIPWAMIVEGFRSELEMLLYSINVKKQVGGFSPVEKALALKRLFRIDSDVEDSFFSLLNVSRKNDTVQQYLALADAPDEIKNLVHSGTLHEQTAFTIMALEQPQRVYAARFICGIAMGTKKRNELLCMIRDIAERDGTGFHGVIESSTLQSILSNSAMDPVHIADKLYRYISELRYPYIHAFNERFNRKLKDVKLNRKFHLRLPENFEKWEFQLLIPFSSQLEFLENIKMLEKTGQKEAFRELMDLRY